MNFELTISGLCVVAMKAATPDEIPEVPDAVEILCPKAPGHCARLTYLPGDVIPHLEASMVIGNTGQRIASLDLVDAIFDISFSSPPNAFFVHVGKPDLKVPPPSDAMNFVPTLDELGLYGYVMPPPNQLPSELSARITLPPGEIFANDIVTDRNTGAPVRWYFPKKAGLTRALANRVVYRAMNAGNLTIAKSDGETVLQASGNKTVQMSLSNDDCIVPLDYNNPVDALRDLRHLAELTHSLDPFEPPTIAPGQRTGRPICNQVIFVY